jgi:alkylhydroperoxidase family enzyme
MSEPKQSRIAPLPPEGEAPPLNIFRTLAHNEGLSKAFRRFGAYLLGGGVLPERERELVILRVGWSASSEYEFGQHRVIGRKAGLTDAEIERLADCGSGEWSRDDAALVAMVDELCAADVVSEPTWQLLRERWDEPELLELLALAGFYRLVSGMLNSAGVALEPGTAGWPEAASPRHRATRAEEP